LADIEKLIKRSLPQEMIAGFEPDPNAKPEPIRTGRQQPGRQKQRSAKSSSRSSESANHAREKPSGTGGGAQVRTVSKPSVQISSGKHRIP
jgi:ATP-dependent RNA helicase RhlE